MYVCNNIDSSNRENRQKIIFAGGTSPEIPKCNSVLLFGLASSVADLGCLLRIPNPKFSIPDPGSKNPGSRIRIRIKELSIFNPNNCF
jgi:hypothetical protein